MIPSRAFAASAAVLLLAACAAPPAAGPRLAPAEAEGKILQASGALARGDYRSLKSAVELYRAVSEDARYRDRVAPDLLKAALTLAVRMKPLGIEPGPTLRVARRVVEDTPRLTAARACLMLVASLTRTVDQIFQKGEVLPGMAFGLEESKAARATVEKAAERDELAAIVLADQACGLGAFSEGYRDPAKLAARFPESRALAFAAAGCPEPDEDRLKAFLAANPEFAEAKFLLGKAAISRGEALTAEGLLLEAADAIPESPQVPLVLGALYFATEEYDRSLEFYGRTLALEPENRDALLGEAVTLSSTGRSDEALAVCERILALGFYMIGEAEYWKAWNLHELKRDAEALEAVDQAKLRLGNAEVNALAGTVGLSLGQEDRAEKDFRAALGFNDRNVESLYGLGVVAGRRSQWAESGGFFARGAEALAARAEVLERRIEEIQKAPLAPARKERMLARKRLQVEQTQSARASAALQAAVAFAAAGDPGKSQAWAARAAEHPSTAARAQELLKKLGG